jgi:NADH dehydrogenase/NADH:ubiquinone oxidoreductase subunit G
MTDMIQATINGLAVEVPAGSTVLQAARQVSVHIPTLCKHPDLDATAACGICIVRVGGSNKMLRACCTPVENGMDITTEDPEIIHVRRTVIEMILSKHPNECLTCGRNQNCELQTLAADFGLRDVHLDSIVPDLPLDDTTKAIVLDPRKCITCGRCIQVCQQIQDVWALSFVERGIETRIAPAGDITLADSPCVRCGQCSAHCPTGAIVEYDNTHEVWDKLLDPDVYCVAQLAPAVRVAIGEAFGFPVGTNLTGQTYAALRRMGFNAVFDTNFGADLTIMEEATEFVKRFTTEGSVLPLITTCCPSWVDFMEKFHSDMIPNFSSCKSPQAMVGALAKTYYAEKMGSTRPRSTSSRSCPARPRSSRSSAARRWPRRAWDVDVSLTTRELARMIKQSGINFRTAQGRAARPAARRLHRRRHDLRRHRRRHGSGASHRLQPHHRREPDAHRIPEDTRPGRASRKARSSSPATRSASPWPTGWATWRRSWTRVRAARDAGTEPPYHFIEVMACPAVASAAAGSHTESPTSLRAKRAAGLYEEDQGGLWRCAHDNPYIQSLYRDFLGEPGGDKSHHLLHTSYTARPTYKR